MSDDDVSQPDVREVARDAGAELREMRGPKTFPIVTDPDPEEES